MATLTELKLDMRNGVGCETWTKSSPETCCKADATCPCVVASDEGETIPDATTGNSRVSVADVDCVGAPVAFKDARTACDTAETIC